MATATAATATGAAIPTPSSSSSMMSWISVLNYHHTDRLYRYLRSLQQSTATPASPASGVPFRLPMEMLQIISSYATPTLLYILDRSSRNGLGRTTQCIWACDISVPASATQWEKEQADIMMKKYGKKKAWLTATLSSSIIGATTTATIMNGNNNGSGANGDSNMNVPFGRYHRSLYLPSSPVMIHDNARVSLMTYTSSGKGSSSGGSRDINSDGTSELVIMTPADRNIACLSLVAPVPFGYRPPLLSSRSTPQSDDDADADDEEGNDNDEETPVADDNKGITGVGAPGYMMDSLWSMSFTAPTTATGAGGGDVISRMEWSSIFIPSPSLSTTGTAGRSAHGVGNGNGRYQLHMIGRDYRDNRERPSGHHIMYESQPIMNTSSPSSSVSSSPWTVMTQSPGVPRNYAAICQHGSLLIVCGGIRPSSSTRDMRWDLFGSSSSSSVDYQSICESYHLVTKQWNVLPFSLKTPRAGGHAIVIDNHIHIMGGRTNDSSWETSIEVLSRQKGVGFQIASWSLPSADQLMGVTIIDDSLVIMMRHEATTMVPGPPLPPPWRIPHNHNYTSKEVKEGRRYIPEHTNVYTLWRKPCVRPLQRLSIDPWARMTEFDGRDCVMLPHHYC